MADIRHFSSLRVYLSAVLAEKKEKHVRFSLRSWSRQLGFRTPSYLSAVLRGLRAPNAAFLASVAKNLKLSEVEERRLQLLNLADRARTDSQRELPLLLLEWVGEEHKFVGLQLDQFRLIADWYHLVIFDMVELSDFRWDNRTISRRLGGSVPPTLVGQAIERLIRLGLLKKAGRRKLVKGTGAPVAGDTVPSEAIRNHHRQFIEKACTALERFPPEERDFCGTTFAIRRRDMEKIRVVIRRAHREIQKFGVANGEADEIFRFNSQLFPVTEGAA